MLYEAAHDPRVAEVVCLYLRDWMEVPGASIAAKLGVPESNGDWQEWRNDELRGAAACIVLPEPKGRGNWGDDFLAQLAEHLAAEIRFFLEMRWERAGWKKWAVPDPRLTRPIDEHLFWAAKAALRLPQRHGANGRRYSLLPCTRPALQQIIRPKSKD